MDICIILIINTLIFRVMKKILISAAVAAALVTGLVVGLHSIWDIDPILEANVEALSRGESGGGRAICYSQYVINDNMRCLKCGSCGYVNGVGVTKGGYCRW